MLTNWIFVSLAATLLIAKSGSAFVHDGKAEKEKCPEGKIRDLNGDCVKKFVLPKRKACSNPELRFGTVDLKAGGRVVYFNCHDGWRLAPEEDDHAMCSILGKWDRPVANCVRPGCSPLTGYSGDITAEYEDDEAVVKLRCRDDESVIMREDSSRSESLWFGCDGQYWNATADSLRCVSRTTTTTTTTTPWPSLNSRTVQESENSEDEENGSTNVGTSKILMMLSMIFVVFR